MVKKRVAVPVLRLPTKLLLRMSRLRRGMTLGVRAAVFDGHGRVFLVRHSYTPGWYLPGGGVEPGETLEAALARELMEEGGITLDRPAVLFGFYLNRGMSQRDHVALFVSRDWRQAAQPKIPNLEIVECGFFAAADLPPDVSKATCRRLAEIIGKVPRAAEW